MTSRVVVCAARPAITEAIASAIAAVLVGGEQIALLGPLGAGKTCFVRGLVAGLGGNRRKVRSPTFTIHHPLEGGRLTVDHYDAYFVREEDEFARDGVAEQRAAGHVVVIEWADRFPELEHESDLVVRLRVRGEEEREIECEGALLETHRELATEIARIGNAPLPDAG